MQEIFSRLGYLASITTDNGKQFNCQEMKQFCKKSGIHLFHTIPYCSQQNGEIERQDRDIIKRLKISQTTKTNRKEDFLNYIYIYHDVHATPPFNDGKNRKIS